MAHRKNGGGSPSLYESFQSIVPGAPRRIPVAPSSSLSHGTGQILIAPLRLHRLPGFGNAGLSGCLRLFRGLQETHRPGSSGVSETVRLEGKIVRKSFSQKRREAMLWLCSLSERIVALKELPRICDMYIMQKAPLPEFYIL